MNLFFKKANRGNNTRISMAMIVLGIGLFLWLTIIQEEKILNFYLESNYYTEQMMKDEIDYAIRNDFTSADVALQRADAKIRLKKYQALESGKHDFFLESERDIQYFNVELSDEFDGLNYQNYHAGKQKVNDYLLANHLPLKSLSYSSDSAIFTMNVLEFLSSPLFFLAFFLLMPMTYLKKYEDGRINFLLTQPLKRSQIILADYKFFLKSSGAVLIYTSLSALLLSFIYSRELTLNYPVLLTLLGKTTIIPIYQYLLLLCLTYFFIGSFIFLLAYTCLLLLKKSMAAILVTIFLCITWNTVISHYNNTLTGFTPFSYVDVETLSKSTQSPPEPRYVMQTDRNINVQKELSVGFVIENPYYYANDSIAKENGASELVLLPIILSLFSLGLLACSLFLLNRY